MTMHLQHLRTWAGPACDPQSAWPCTVRRDRVTCEACKQTPEFTEAEFAARHSVLTDDDVAWARSQLPGAKDG